MAIAWFFPFTCAGDRGEIQLWTLGNPVKWMKEFLQKEEKLEEMDFQQNGTITELLFVVSWEKETLMSSAKYKPLEISICRHGWSDSFNKSWECSLKLLRLQLTTKWLEAQNHTLNSWQSSIAANVLVGLCHQFIFVWYFFSSKKKNVFPSCIVLILQGASLWGL